MEVQRSSGVKLLHDQLMQTSWEHIRMNTRQLHPGAHSSILFKIPGLTFDQISRSDSFMVETSDLTENISSGDGFWKAEKFFFIIGQIPSPNIDSMFPSTTTVSSTRTRRERAHIPNVFSEQSQ